MNWICCQLGAREHYAVPRALQAKGQLAGLVTDAWVRPRSPLGLIKRSLRERCHPDLATASVSAWNFGLLAFEFTARGKRLSGWPLIMARNRWFQRRAVNSLKAMCQSSVVSRQSSRSLPTVFAYSYAALEIFRWAKAQGWRTVLGQIDPGPVEEAIVARLHDQHRSLAPEWQPAPPAYWELWRAECQLADRIVVNSEWSQTALLQEGVPSQKLRVIPLAYESPARVFQRSSVSGYSALRPLRVLFLGQINLRKGIAEVFEAIRLLSGSPVEFWFVGPVQVAKPSDLNDHPQIRWLGSVARGEAARFYKQADVFLLPTHSDGFALTQLEAQAWNLPAITSKYCGEVVEHGRNGLLLGEVDAKSVADALRMLLTERGLLKQLSDSSGIDWRFTPQTLASNLMQLH